MAFERCSVISSGDVSRRSTPTATRRIWDGRWEFRDVGSASSSEIGLRLQAYPRIWSSASSCRCFRSGNGPIDVNQNVDGGKQMPRAEPALKLGRTRGAFRARTACHLVDKVRGLRIRLWRRLNALRISTRSWDGVNLTKSTRASHRGDCYLDRGQLDASINRPQRSIHHRAPQDGILY